MTKSIEHDLRIALYQPDIPQNTGTILRLGACMNVPVDIIEPAGFVLNEKGLRRAGMDYLNMAAIKRHADWLSFKSKITQQGKRLVLLTTKSDKDLYDFEFQNHDTLLFGRESAGVPSDIHQSVAHRITIPMSSNARSLNIAVSAAMALGEAMRQIRLNVLNGQAD